MKATRKTTSAKRKTVNRKSAPRKARLRRTPGAKATTRKSELVDRLGGYTGDRGDARSATSGIP